MSMVHKAFLFDTVLFNKEVAGMILEAGVHNDTEVLRYFIERSIGRARSPYTGEVLEAGWETELENGTIQELADFVMACYYDPKDDKGLAYEWDSLLEALKKLITASEANALILGRALKKDGFSVDPGYMGTGFVQAEKVPALYDTLCGWEKNVKQIVLETNSPQLANAFASLKGLYREALAQGRGLLLTF